MGNMTFLNSIVGLLLLVAAANSQSRNVLSIVGKTITLECKVPLADPPKVRWVDWIHNNGRDPQGIFNSDGNPDRNMDASHPSVARMSVGEDFSLTITELDGDVVTGDSGEYICISVQDDGQELEDSIQLSMAGVPECSGEGDLMEGNDASYTCKVPFSGAEFPTLGWYLDEEEVEKADNSAVGIAQIAYNINPAAGMYDGKTLTCKMQYGDESDECKIPLTVKYKVNEVKIMPTSEDIRVDDKITCTANGNPEAEVVLKFSGEDIQETVTGDKVVSLTVPKSWEGKEVAVVCIGSNELEGVVADHKTEVTFNVEAPPTTTTTTTTESTVGIKTEVVIVTEPPKPEPTDKIAPVTPKEDEKTGDKKPPTKQGGGNIIGIIAGVIIAALVIVVIVIAVACILRKSSKKHKGAKPVPTKEEDMKRMEDGRA